MDDYKHKYRAARVDRPRQVVKQPYCDIHGTLVDAAVLHYYMPEANGEFDICEDCLEAGLKKVRESTAEGE